MKPELLLPVGTTEAFYAALEGGADAVYLGLRKFNARGRAKNFTVNQLQSLLKEADKNKIGVYVTLNTLIKNSELSELLDTLYILSQTTLNAVIIQDWGVYYLIKKFFPKLRIHASTQMKIHNSEGTNFLEKKGFERVILARELTFAELSDIRKKSKIDLEIFAHGALCYSFSGMCFFSSYLGGMSANRGLCRQPCRRIYESDDKSGYFFSLKDLQLIRLLPEILKLNIRSLKIEGRMKSAEYVYQVAAAYRMAIDDLSKIAEAEKLLEFDFGREKTSYFIGNKVGGAITESPFAGVHIGEIIRSSSEAFSFVSSLSLSKGNRIRILPQNGEDSKAIKIKELKIEGDDKNGKIYSIPAENNFQKNDKVFLVGWGNKKFKNRFSMEGKRLQLRLSEKKKKNILARIGSKKTEGGIQLFLRIDSLNWLRKISFREIDFLILNLARKEWEEFDLNKSFLQKNLKKIILELPKFIPEERLELYRKKCYEFNRKGITNFMINQISQKNLFSGFKNIKLFAGENVYSLNDAAIQFLKEENIRCYIYPIENDYPNLISGKDRMGIVPLYFYPELFYSRMPVSIQSKNKELPNFKDRNFAYYKIVRDGISIVVPEIPVSLLQYKDKLYQKGFRRFLIDFSHTKPSQNRFKKILKKFHYSETEQPSTNFNFKMGLK